MRGEFCALFSFSNSQLRQHLFLLWRRWRAFLLTTLPHKEVRSWTTLCFFTHNQLLSIFHLFQSCVYIAVFLRLASPSGSQGSHPHLPSFTWRFRWWRSGSKVLSKQPSWRHKTVRVHLVRIRSGSFLEEFDVSSTVTCSLSFPRYSLFLSF